MKKRLISLLLAFSMMLTFLPAGAVSAFAEENIGRRIEDNATIRDGGTYSLSGTYTKGIKIDTSAPVTINIADKVSFQPEGNAGSNVLLDVVTDSDLTVNNNGVYNGPTFLHTSTESNNAKVTIHGGRYNITNQPGVRTRAFAFDEGGSVENPIVVDGVHIDTDSYCEGIDVGNGEQTAPKVMIKNSEINCFGRNYDDGVIKIVDNQGSVTLENVTVYAANISAIEIRGGNLTINSGHYTSDGGQVVDLYDNRTPNVPEVTINGGEFIGNDPESSTILVASGTMKIHGGTFTSTKDGGVLSNSHAHTIIDSTVSVPEFNSEGGIFDAIDNTYGGHMEFNNGIINVSGGTVSGFQGRAALYTRGPYDPYISKTEINGGTIKGATYGVRVEGGCEPDVILRNVQFENNGTDIYLGSGQKITIEDTFKNNATIDCYYPMDGRQLTTATTGTEYQKDLNLTSANEDYLVAYKKTESGEYRYLAKKVGVTIEGLENAVIKEGESKNFTVKVDPKGDAKLGEAFIDFGDKNGEIEYLDDNGVYQPMPKEGRKVNLNGDNKNYEFRITPKDAGDQKLTAAVVRDAVEVGKDSETYHVAGRVHTTVTIEGLENAVIKEGENKDFTVKVTPNDDANLGEAFIDFGDKNSEIEYKDEESGEYKPMPEGGLPIDLGDVKEQYAFRIAPKETGKQTLTAAVKQDKKELARDEKDFVVSEMPILTLKDGVITSVTVPGKNGADPEDITEIVKKNANEDGSFNVPEGATVSVAFDKDAFADSGLKFGHWDITGLDDPNAYQNKECFAFEMPAKGVTLKAMTQDASIEDDEPDIVGPIVIGTTVVVGGAVLGYQAYSLGAEFAGKLMALPYFPSNRSALAMMLWEDAGKPMPESELLYPDIEQEEQDMDLQHAARWAMENELIPDLNDEGTAPEEMKFYPDNAVSKIDVLNAWQKAQELKQNA